MSGTSMATPYGSGFLALVIELMRRQGQARWTAVEAVREWMRANMTDRGAPGFDPRFGHGIPVADSLIQKLLRSDLTWA
jgi:hypothetical protein